MGSVWEAVDIHTDERVAVKLVHARLREARDLSERFRREGQILASLRHPCIVKVTDFGGLPDGGMFIAMELLEGETLRDRMVRRGAMSVPEVWSIASDVAEGLVTLHGRGILHRDLKPANIYLPATGPAKLVDFGVAMVYWQDRLTATGEVLGTVRWMAPEQLAGERDLDVRVDVYALGVMLYEMLTARHPYKRGDSAVVKAILSGQYAPLDGVDPKVARVVERALAPQREDRWPSVGELMAAFADAAGIDPGMRSSLQSAPTLETSAVTAPARPAYVAPRVPAADPESIRIAAVPVVQAVPSDPPSAVTERDPAPVLERAATSDSAQQTAEKSQRLPWFLAAGASCLLVAVLSVAGGAALMFYLGEEEEAAVATVDSRDGESTLVADPSGAPPRARGVDPRGGDRGATLAPERDEAPATPRPPGSECPDLTGEWSGTWSSFTSRGTWSVDWTQEESGEIEGTIALRGTVCGRGGDIRGRMQGEDCAVEFGLVDTTRCQVSYEGTLDGDSLEGTLTASGLGLTDRGRWEGSRVPAE